MSIDSMTTTLKSLKLYGMAQSIHELSEQAPQLTTRLKRNYKN